MLLENLQNNNMGFFLSCGFLLVGGKTPDASSLKNVRTYKDIIEQQDLVRDQVCCDSVCFRL